MARTGRPRGSKTVQGGRAWARSVADRPDVRAFLELQATRDPDIALRIYEHGYGRAPQALDINTGNRPIAGLTVLAPTLALGEVPLSALEETADE